MRAAREPIRLLPGVAGMTLTRVVRFIPLALMLLLGWLQLRASKAGVVPG
jgi:hypothetical protein